MPPLKYLGPNSFTAASMLLGLASAVMSASASTPGDFELAAWMILWATLLDKADGTVARLLGATSAFGVQFDSFADFVAFGIAPAALVFYRVVATGAPALLVAVAAGVYVVALAVRLARFNITAGSEPVFYGIPGTMMGAIVASAYLTWDKYHLPPAMLDAAPAVLVVASALMVSSIRIPKLKLRKRKWLNVFQTGNVVAAYIVGPLMVFPEYLLGLAICYLVVGVAWCLMHPVPSVVREEETPREQLA